MIECSSDVPVLFHSLDLKKNISNHNADRILPVSEWSPVKYTLSDESGRYFPSMFLPALWKSFKSCRHFTEGYAKTDYSENKQQNVAVSDLKMNFYVKVCNESERTKYVQVFCRELQVCLWIAENSVKNYRHSLLPIRRYRFRMTQPTIYIGVRSTQLSTLVNMNF